MARLHRAKDDASQPQSCWELSFCCCEGAGAVTLGAVVGQIAEAEAVRLSL
jgi:hypothetical protein